MLANCCISIWHVTVHGPAGGICVTQPVTKVLPVASVSHGMWPWSCRWHLCHTACDHGPAGGICVTRNVTMVMSVASVSQGMWRWSCRWCLCHTECDYGPVGGIYVTRNVTMVLPVASLSLPTSRDFTSVSQLTSDSPWLHFSFTINIRLAVTSLQFHH